MCVCGGDGENAAVDKETQREIGETEKRKGERTYVKAQWSRLSVLTQ